MISNVKNYYCQYGRLGGSSLKNNESPLSVQFDKFEALLDRTTHSSILPSNSSSASTLRSSYTVHFAGILVFAFFFLSPESGCFQFWCKLAMDHEPYDSSGEFHFKVPFFLPVSASFNSFLILGLGLCLGFFVFNSSFYGLLGSVV